jgi:hypothetical protein
MSQHDQLDALARGSQREEKRHGGDSSMTTIWKRREMTVFVTGRTAGMKYERARELSAYDAKEKEYNDEYSD